MQPRPSEMIYFSLMSVYQENMETSFEEEETVNNADDGKIILLV